MLVQYEMLIIRLTGDLVKECWIIFHKFVQPRALKGAIMMPFLFCFLKASLESLLMKRWLKQHFWWLTDDWRKTV